MEFHDVRFYTHLIGCHISKVHEMKMREREEIRFMATKRLGRRFQHHKMRMKHALRSSDVSADIRRVFAVVS